MEKVEIVNEKTCWWCAKYNRSTTLCKHYEIHLARTKEDCEFFKERDVLLEPNFRVYGDHSFTKRVDIAALCLDLMQHMTKYGGRANDITYGDFEPILRKHVRIHERDEDI